MAGEGVGRAPVGRVIGTEDATPLTFWVALAPEQYLQLDDVVVCERAVPGRSEPIRLSGVVTQVRARHEGAHFDSDVFLISDGVLPADAVEAAEISTTRVEPEVYVPPRPGAEVRRAGGAERDHALFFDTMDHRLPIGLGRDGEPLFANLDFVDGTRGAHVNISGISGVATKTTYATFLLYSLLHCDALPDAHNTRALIFNVKGEDLLFLDHDNTQLDQVHRDRYRRLGLMPGAFKQLAVFAPPRPGDPGATPDVQSRTQGVHPFFWTIEEFVSEELLPFAFADAEDDRQQYTIVVSNVTSRLRAGGRPGVGAGDWQVPDYDATGAEVGWRTLVTYDDVVDYVQERVEDDATRAYWAGPATGMGTINAFLRRLISSRRALGRLVRADVETKQPHRIDTDAAQVTVVDLHNLPDRAQRFVVGVTLRRAFDRKEQSGHARPLLFVVLDELNKYAPREGDSPIKDILLDVAERGRSLGIILVGAQQTASEVERRVVSNCAIRVVGRLDAAEAARPEYGFLPPAHQKRATIAKPGTMFVMQPEIPVPLVVEFPFPAWATRPSERGSPPAAPDLVKSPDDPFAGIPGSTA